MEAFAIKSTPYLSGGKANRRGELFYSAALALALHAGLFFTGNKLFYHEAEYGVEISHGSIEMDLVAALPAHERPEAPQPELSEEAIPAAPTKEGDGSSPDPGKDTTTIHSPGSAEIVAKPGYLRNPAPRYPEVCRRNGQEGLVMLLVTISREGHTSDVKVIESSGVTLLDQAAEAAVRKWQFVPARIGDLKVESKIRLPVRFEIKKAKHAS